MKKDHFYKLFENPGETSSTDLKELDKILSNHPYFTSARILKVKALLSRKSIVLNEEIAKNGNHYPNHLVLEDWAFEMVANKEPEVDQKIEAEELKDVALEIIDLLPTSAGYSESFPETHKTENKNEEIQEQISGSDEDLKIEKKSAPIETTESEEKPVSSTNSLPTKPKEELVEPEIENLKESEEITDEPESTNPEGDGGIADEVLRTLNQLRKARETLTGTVEKKAPKKTPAPVKKSKSTGAVKSKESSPTKISSGKKPSKTPSKNPETKAKKVSPKKVSLSKKKVDKEEKAPDKEQMDKEQKLKIQKSLIKEFITNPPAIEKGYLGEDGPNKDLALPSTKENHHLVSESLAKIFTRQGKTEKARGVYQKLMLKYPKKKSYFAAQIKTLEK